MPIEVEKEMAALERMSAGQLLERFAELFGETTQSRNRIYLIRKILWKMQTREMGSLSERARMRAEELAKDAEFRVMTPPEVNVNPAGAPVSAGAITLDPRLPPAGTALLREYKGRTYEVQVKADGFECDGEWFKSLTAVASWITGTHTNGYRFFQLEGKK